MNRVTPNLEHVPRRSYVYEDLPRVVGEGYLICNEVIAVQEPLFQPVLGKELFRIRVSKEQAAALLEDLYYGEYTGA